MLATCNVCVEQGREPFRVPWDRIGAALMQAHLDEHDRTDTEGDE